MMSSHHGSAGGGGLNGAFRGVVVVLSLCATIFIVPQLWPYLDADVWRWLSQLYEPAAASLLHLGIEVAMWPLTFFGLRAGARSSAPR